MVRIFGVFEFFEFLKFALNFFLGLNLVFAEFYAEFCFEFW